MGITDWVSKYTGHKYRKLKREHESEKKAGYKDALLKESYELRDEMYKDIGKMDDYLHEQKQGYLTKRQLKKLLKKLTKSLHSELGDLEKILAKGVGAVLVLASGVAFYYPKYTGAAVMNFQDKMQINTSVFLGLAMFALGMILLFRKK